MTGGMRELCDNYRRGKQMRALQVGGRPLDVSQESIDARYAEYQQLIQRACDVFGNVLEAHKWLTSSSTDFDHRTPLQALELGKYEETLQVLGRIEHGVIF